MKRIILLTGAFNYSKEQIKALENLGCEIVFVQNESDNLPSEAFDAELIVCNGLFLHHCLDNFKSLRFIQLTSAGFDRVPLNDIKQRGISIYNARGVYSIPMAEWTVLKVLEHYKQGLFFSEKQREKSWTKNRSLREIFGKQVALVGAGNVGREVAKRFQAFGAHTTGFDIQDSVIEGFDRMNLIETLYDKISLYDIVVVTAPLLPSTKGLISREILLSMKSGAILVNIARGGLIDEQAMCEVLADRKDIYAALDVFEEEPLSENSPLWEFENVAISPHNSFVSDGNNMRMFDVIYNNVKNYINQQ